MNDKKKATEKKVDKAGEMSFPASDAPGSHRTTGSEPPARPVDRKAPVITREQIEAARKGEGHLGGHRPKGTEDGHAGEPATAGKTKHKTAAR